MGFSNSEVFDELANYVVERWGRANLIHQLIFTNCTLHVGVYHSDEE